MSPTARQEYCEEVAIRYHRIRKDLKPIMLDHFCDITKYHRKYAINKLNHCHEEKKRKRRPGRPSLYKQNFVVEPLRKIWKASDMPCSTRLKVIIEEWMPYMKNDIPPPVQKILLKISSATIDRVLRPYRTGRRRRMFCRTQAGRFLRTKIPIRNNQWDEKRPGFLEADTVAHCGHTLLGEFVNTIDTVDFATGWTEQRAVFGKSVHQVVDQIQDIEHVLPFKLRGFDSDNGSEFLNYTLMRYFTNRADESIQFTRSRPYHKDDNSHVEQKNWTHVRYWFGYYRFDNPNVVDLFNDLYKNEWRLYHNFFLPSVKLISKVRVGSRIVKKHDQPQTPYKRLLASEYIDLETKEKLKAQFKLLNPFRLRLLIQQKLKVIFENKNLLEMNSSW